MSQRDWISISTKVYQWDMLWPVKVKADINRSHVLRSALLFVFWEICEVELSKKEL